MKLLNKLSLRLRITLITGLVICVTALCLTFTSIYNNRAALISIVPATIHDLAFSADLSADQVESDGKSVPIRDYNLSAGLPEDFHLSVPIDAPPPIPSSDIDRGSGGLAAGSPAGAGLTGAGSADSGQPGSAVVGGEGSAEEGSGPDAEIRATVKIVNAATFTDTFTIKALDARQAFNYRSYLILALITSAGMAISYFAAGRALRPVRQLDRAIAGISAQELSERLPEPGVRDEIGSLTMSFNAMLDRLEDSFQRQKRFSSNVAHELKTPLATMKMSLQMLAMDDQALPAESQDILAIMERGVNRLIDLVGDLMTLANEGLENLDEPICPARLLQTSAEELLPLYEKKHLRLEYAFPAEEIWIPGNAGLARQALSNLVENAMKYSQEDGSLRLGVAQNADGEVLISVANSCAGIPEQSLDKIFEPFYCVDPSRSRKMGGAGLGLSIVKSIADRHGWRVQAESLPDFGAVFTILVPGKAASLEE